MRRLSTHYPVATAAVVPSKPRPPSCPACRQVWQRMAEVSPRLNAPAVHRKVRSYLVCGICWLYRTTKYHSYIIVHVPAPVFEYSTSTAINAHVLASTRIPGTCGTLSYCTVPALYYRSVVHCTSINSSYYSWRTVPSIATIYGRILPRC